MVKYKINLIFNESNKSLNDILTEVLKIELESMFKTTCIISESELTLGSTHYFQKKAVVIKTHE